MKRQYWKLTGAVMFIVALVAALIGGAEAAGAVLIAEVGLTVDEQVAKKLGEEIKGLGEQIDSKIKAALTPVEENGEKRVKELTTTLKDELTGMIKEHNEKFEEYTKRLDLIETKAGRFGQVMQRKTFADVMAQKISDEDMVNQYKNNGKAAMTFTEKDLGELQLKADDMTSSTNFTNNVPGYDHLPEIHFDPDRKTRARDLILQGTTNTTAVEYIRETTYNDATDVTSEGAEFKQNDFDLTAYTANVRKITNYIMMSEEMLEDVAGMTSYIMARLPAKINAKEDTQILEGSGSGQNLSGLVTNATSYSDNLADSNVQRIDVIVDAVRQVVDDEYMPTAIVLHPADFYQIALTKDSNGQYILPWILGVVNPQLAGVPIVTTTAITSGDFLILSRNAAQVFFRKELTVEFSNQNEDNFIKGMVTVRAQKRLALAIYRTTPLLTGDFTVALAQGTA